MSYSQFIKQTEALFVGALSEGGRMPSSLPKLSAHEFMSQGIKPNILIVAPHPDDECLMGGYALRLKQELGASVLVAAYSLGSKVERQAERDEELNRSVKKLGFTRIPGVTNTAQEIADILTQFQVSHLISPHAQDGHATHIRTYEVCRDALKIHFSNSAPSTDVLSGAFQKKKVLWLQTEYWQSLPAPNLLVRLESNHVITLGEAMMEHQGEVNRNPFHLRMPAWYMDQVRRGSERVMGAGAQGVDAAFGQLFTQLECNGAEESQWTPTAARLI